MSERVEQLTHGKDVDEGSTVTDFLPAERARGITIQSAAITFHWPPTGSSPAPPSSTTPAASGGPNTINLIDTPGHADFTFEVIRSLRILDGAICILDGVAGVEAQTEKVWNQANGYRIPRLVYVNKLDRNGAAFNRTVREIASRLHTWPALCQIPWWKSGEFVGVADLINLRGLLWPKQGDGSSYQTYNVEEIRETDESLAKEMLVARKALIEALSEHDEILVDEFFNAEEDYERLPGEAVLQSARRILLSGGQKITPVFAGASFRNIGVQPILDAINNLLPSPQETQDPVVSIGQSNVFGLRQFQSGASPPLSTVQTSAKAPKTTHIPSTPALQRLSACALAFKVVHDPRRGVLVYIRVYAGTLHRSALLYNTNLGTSERVPRLLHMYASDTLEASSITSGCIGAIVGLKHARTGDTLIVYAGASPKTPPPPPLNTLQLQPIVVPPPLFFASIEPNSLAEEKLLNESLEMLLREDPSLSVSTDEESGQTHLAGMGELHLEIARDKLVGEYKVKASMGKIEIGYREAMNAESGPCTSTFDREVAGRKASASCTAAAGPAGEVAESMEGELERVFALPDENCLRVEHPTISSQTGKPISADHSALPHALPLTTCLTALRAGATAALARGPLHALPVHSTSITITFNPATHLTSSTTSAALTSAARLAVQAALKDSAVAQPVTLMEPVMLASITVDESHLGAVVHDISSARGGHVLSLDADEAPTDSNISAPQQVAFTLAQLERVYAPPDPFGSQGGDAGGAVGTSGLQQRQIRARVPLKEMVGYLKHLRSLTGGRGTFVMSVDRFERMSRVRMKAALAEMRGEFG